MISPLTYRQREVILAFAECNMKIEPTAKKMFVSYSTVEYHLWQIKAKTGKDPKNFYDLYDLVQMVKGEAHGT